ncbi:hypothetical protein [Streptomyces catenulae]|uniref:DUF1453 domain-containing protein n=1 Tax=Streptomyces catenulae TaxID=66875 RepID=A0ABV2Z179_9ACTN|nr:hypothetical protein [Streptomyces catenulae]
MSGLLNTVVIIAVVAYVFIRQFSAQPLSSRGSNIWLVPAILGGMALREPHLLDAAHPTAAAVLLAAGTLLGLASGAGWAWTTTMWTEADGTVWTKGGLRTAVVWLCGMAVRLGLGGVGHLWGVHQGTGTMMLSIAAMLLSRSGVTLWRARSVQPAYRVPVGG